MLAANFKASSAPCRSKQSLYNEYRTPTHIAVTSIPGKEALAGRKLQYCVSDVDTQNPQTLFCPTLSNTLLVVSQHLRYFSSTLKSRVVGTLKSSNPLQQLVYGSQVNLSNDHRYMPQIVSSAIVNAPPPEGVIKTLHVCSTAHKNIDKSTKVGRHTDQTPIKSFELCSTVI